jgi:hypothetical protein
MFIGDDAGEEALVSMVIGLAVIDKNPGETEGPITCNGFDPYGYVSTEVVAFCVKLSNETENSDVDTWPLPVHVTLNAVAAGTDIAAGIDNFIDGVFTETNVGEPTESVTFGFSACVKGLK